MCRRHFLNLQDSAVVVLGSLEDLSFRLHSQMMRPRSNQVQNAGTRPLKSKMPPRRPPARRGRSCCNYYLLRYNRISEILVGYRFFVGVLFLSGAVLLLPGVVTFVSYVHPIDRALENLKTVEDRVPKTSREVATFLPELGQAIETATSVLVEQEHSTSSAHGSVSDQNFRLLKKSTDLMLSVAKAFTDRQARARKHLRTTSTNKEECRSPSSLRPEDEDSTENDSKNEVLSYEQSDGLSEKDPSRGRHGGRDKKRIAGLRDVFLIAEGFLQRHVDRHFSPHVFLQNVAARGLGVDQLGVLNALGNFANAAVYGNEKLMARSFFKDCERILAGLDAVEESSSELEIAGLRGFSSRRTISESTTKKPLVLYENELLYQSRLGLTSTEVRADIEMALGNWFHFDESDFARAEKHYERAAALLEPVVRAGANTDVGAARPALVGTPKERRRQKSYVVRGILNIIRKRGTRRTSVVRYFSGGRAEVRRNHSESGHRRGPASRGGRRQFFPQNYTAAFPGQFRWTNSEHLFPPRAR